MEGAIKHVRQARKSSLFFIGLVAIAYFIKGSVWVLLNIVGMDHLSRLYKYASVLCGVLSVTYLFVALVLLHSVADVFEKVDRIETDKND